MLENENIPVSHESPLTYLDLTAFLFDIICFYQIFKNLMIK